MKHKPGNEKEELKGKPCAHPKRFIIVDTNRKGRRYKECTRCNAFLGWA